MSERTRKVEDLKPLIRWLRQREEEMAALLAELVAVPTENPPGRKYLEFVELLESRAGKLGLECQRLVPLPGDGRADDNPPSLSLSYGRRQRTLYFHGHYDVVPAQSAQQFQPLRRYHFLFGRGACDMKGGIVAMLFAILALREFGGELHGKVNLILVPDEARAGIARQRWHRHAAGGADKRGRVERESRSPFPAGASVWEVCACGSAAPR